MPYVTVINIKTDAKLLFYMSCRLSRDHDETRSRLRNHLWLSRMVPPESHIGFF
jgi:hypothetical protein